MDSFLAEDLPARDRLIMLNNSLIIRTSRGESIADGLAEMERLGADMSGNWRLFLTDPIANDAMARGDLKKAGETFGEVADSDPGQSPEYQYRAARAYLWAGDLASARDRYEKFEESNGVGPVVEARRLTLRAGIAALEGRSGEALALYRDALRGWRATHALWDETISGIDMAELLDPSDPEVAAVIELTRATLERLRAKPYLERLEAAVARAGGVAPSLTGGARRNAEPMAEAAVTE
jgi:tetratricopeptide (TPR) repeat protein